MRRKRFQKGSLQVRNHGRHRVWVACWWEDGGRRSKVLGRYSQMGKGQAESILSAMLQPINSGVARGPKPVCTFEQFLDEVYLPLCRRSWKKSTAPTSEQIVKTHLSPAFAQIRTLGRPPAQQSGGRVEDSEEMSAGPSDALADRRGGQGLSGGFEIREELISRLTIFEGMVLALRWKAVSNQAVFVEQRIYKRVLDSPKNGKTREIAISGGSYVLLEEWRDLAEDPSPGLFSRARRSLRHCRRTTSDGER